MHKDISVCLMNIAYDGAISNVRPVPSATDHVPLGGQMNPMKFHEWWKDRAIPRTRHGAKPALQRLGYSSTGSALVDNLALSLNDCYWIRPREKDLRWAEVSLFSNDFTDTFGELTFNESHKIDLKNQTRFNSATSQGELQKKWCIHKDGRRFMVKGNHGASFQQSINEVFATSLHKQQGFSHYIPYVLTDITVEGGRKGLGCMSFNFCSENVESISAWEVLQTVKMRPSESYYHTFRKACLSLGISAEDFDTFMDYQIMTDYLLTNIDRHMNNIAVLRNPDTLQFIGLAPVYDSGNAMFYDLSLEEMQRVRFSEIKTHSFVEKECRLLKYVHDRNAVDLDRADMDFSIFYKDIGERHGRVPLLQSLYERKRETLAAFQKGKDIWKSR
ncbi:MAG: hypothetical protein IJP92_16635 [Lachnospiraceae bacterium]|nr:hypothetical protein [Lachnospiraceae bacterium]